MCVCEREREKERESVCLCVYVFTCVRMRVCERVCVHACECVCMRPGACGHGSCRGASPPSATQSDRVARGRIVTTGPLPQRPAQKNQKKKRV